MTPQYDECKQHVEAVQNAYDALMDALDAYYDSLSTRLDRGPELPGELGLALRMQRDGTRRMRSDLEDRILDDLIRLADRVIRVKHAEDGTFV